MKNNGYTPKEKALAAKLYISGKTFTEISELLEVSTTTLQSWKEEFGWDAKKIELQQKLASQVVDDLAKEKLEQLEYIKSLGKEVQDRIANSKNPTSDKLYNVILECKKMELALLGIQFDQRQVKVEHSGKIAVKLEDYFK
jgi:transposase